MIEPGQRGTATFAIPYLREYLREHAHRYEPRTNTTNIPRHSGRHGEAITSTWRVTSSSTSEREPTVATTRSSVPAQRLGLT